VTTAVRQRFRAVTRMRLPLLLVAGFAAAAFPAVAFGKDANPLPLRGGLTPTLGADASAPVPGDGASTPAPGADAQPPALDDIVTGSAPPDNVRVTPEPPVAAVTPSRRPPPDTDPFAALGIRAGSFIIYPSVSTGVGYTTNAAAAAGGKGSGFLAIAPELLIKSDWARHEATLAFRGSFQKFLDGSINDVPTAEVAATGRIDLPDSWTVDLDGTYHYSREAFSDPSFPAGADRAPDVNDFNASTTLNGSVGRTQVTIAGDVERTLYADAHAGAVVIDQGDRDTTLYGGRFRIGYELTPALTPFVEAEATRRVYDRRLDHNGIARASRGVALRGGVAFASGPVLSGDIAIGARRETFDDPALAGLRSLTVDGSLVWSPTPLVTVTTHLATLVNPSTNPASSGSIVYDASVNVAYAYRQNLTFDLTAGADHEHFEGIGSVHRTYRAGAGLTWKINRSLQLTGTYEHEWLVASDPAADYTSDSVRVDLKVQR
jgi:hypothetical protein